MNIFRSGAAKLKPVMPEKLKGGRLERIGNYFKNILLDYKMVAEETLGDIKERPIKASLYLSLIGGIAYLGKTNPSELDFREQLIKNCNDLGQVGEPIRNPNSDSYMQNLLKHYNAGLVRRLNLAVFSLMWIDNFDRCTDLYDSQCKSLKVGWLAMRERTVDIGILGKWWWIEQAMLDYDINPNEWPEGDKNNRAK